MMMTENALPFKYEEVERDTGTTSLAGLPMYLELAKSLGMTDAMAAQLRVRENAQGWSDAEIVMAIIMLQLAGGDCVADLRVLEGDDGFRRILRQAEAEVSGLPRAERRCLVNRWRKQKKRAVPSPSSVFRFLNDCRVDESGREVGKAWIPELNVALKSLRGVNFDVVAQIWKRSPVEKLTLDMDATVKAVSKASALFSYKGSKAYQPLNLYCSELDVVLDSEFRDGNVPAKWRNLEFLVENLERLPAGVKTVQFRSDAAAFQTELILYLANGLNERFGKIDFTISMEVGVDFRQAVASVAEHEWKNIHRVVTGKDGKVLRVEETGHECAEVAYTSKAFSYSKKNAELRFIAIRQRLDNDDAKRLQKKKAAQLELPFQMIECQGGSYKLHGIVTSLMTAPGEAIVKWHWERCGKGEEVHDVMKHDLAGGRVPSGHFGGNAAWWAIMVLAFNLNSAMRRLVLGGRWSRVRLKAIRFSLINMAGRVVEHARQVIIRVSKRHPSLPRLPAIRQAILLLAR